MDNPHRLAPPAREILAQRNPFDTFKMRRTQHIDHCGIMPHGGTEPPLAKKGKKGKKGKR